MNGRLGQMQILGMLVVGLVMLMCYGIMPYIGAAILIVVDNAAFAFRWIGIKNPVVAWAVLGAAAGGLVGLNFSLRRVGIPNLSSKILLYCTAAFASLFVLTCLYCHVMKPLPGPTLPPPPPAPGAQITLYP